jgi:hydroxymethylpyrimidine/phosphomethylpyrimidine kinase
VYGTRVLTAIPAQNPRGVSAVDSVDLKVVRAQIAAVLEAFTVGAAKTGMLFSADLIATVVEALAGRPELRLVVDPVMVATSGACLLEDEAVATLRERLLPRAFLITPNLPEAEVLVGQALRTPQAIRRAAVELAREFGCRVLLKGGHAPAPLGTDLLTDGEQVWEIASPPVARPLSTHGTGCSLSAGIAAGLAAGHDLVTAVRRAKAYVYGALNNCVEVGPGTYAMTPPARLPLGAVQVRRLVIA